MSSSNFYRYGFNATGWSKFKDYTQSICSHGIWEFSNSTISINANANSVYSRLCEATNKTYADQKLKNYEYLAPCRSEENFSFRCIHALDRDIEQIHYRWKPLFHTNRDDFNESDPILPFKGEDLNDFSAGMLYPKSYRYSISYYRSFSFPHF